jgi:hypothetical protein
MGAGVLVMMMTPAQGNLLPGPAPTTPATTASTARDGPVHEKWFAWLTATVEQLRGGTVHLRHRTRRPIRRGKRPTTESLPWLPKIRELGVPAAYVEAGQRARPHRGTSSTACFSEAPPNGKSGLKRPALAREAKARGKTVHMGRVNSRKRLVIAMDMGCDTADGTFLVFGPNKNWPRLRHWIAQGHQTWIGMDQAS